MSSAASALQDFIDDNELDCESWDTMKNTMHVCYQAIIGGMQAVENSIISDLDTLEGSIGDESLDEDVLEARIKMLEAECQQYENCIAQWNTISSGFPNAGFSCAAKGVVGKYNEMIASTESEIAELKEKIIFLHEVEDTTVNLDNIETTNSTLGRKVGEPINGWLQLYDGSSVENDGRIVAIPDEAVANKWAMKENLEQINPYALKEIEGENDVIIGEYGELIDKEGRYWVAVGPKVMNENHKADESCTASEMLYGTKMDVVVCDSKGNEYYIPCIVGDCKNHTYPNGIYQTGYSFPNGEEYASDNVDDSIVEFCGKGPIVGLSDYSIEKIIVYDLE